MYVPESFDTSTVEARLSVTKKLGNWRFSPVSRTCMHEVISNNENSA